MANSRHSGRTMSALTLAIACTVVAALAGCAGTPEATLSNATTATTTGTRTELPTSVAAAMTEATANGSPASTVTPTATTIDPAGSDPTAESLSATSRSTDRTVGITVGVSATEPVSEPGTGEPATAEPGTGEPTTGSAAAADALDAFNDWLTAQPGIDESGYIQSVNEPSDASVTLIWFGESPLQAAAGAEATRRGLTAVIEQWPYAATDLEAAAQALFDQTDAFAGLGFEVSDISAIPTDFRGVDLCGAFTDGSDSDTDAVIAAAAQFTDIPVRVRTDCTD